MTHWQWVIRKAKELYHSDIEFEPFELLTEEYQYEEDAFADEDVRPQEGEDIAIQEREDESLAFRTYVDRGGGFTMGPKTPKSPSK